MICDLVACIPRSVPFIHCTYSMLNCHTEIHDMPWLSVRRWVTVMLCMAMPDYDGVVTELGHVGGIPVWVHWGHKPFSNLVPGDLTIQISGPWGSRAGEQYNEWLTKIKSSGAKNSQHKLPAALIASKIQNSIFRKTSSLFTQLN